MIHSHSILKVARLFTLALLLFVFESLLGTKQNVKVHLLQKEASVEAGGIVTFPVLLTNLSMEPLILVQHLNLPSHLQVVPANDTLIHLAPGQNAQEMLRIIVPEGIPFGDYPFLIEVWQRDNRNIYDADDAHIIMLQGLDDPPEYCEPPPATSIKEPFSITSPLTVDTSIGEIIFITALVQNPYDKQAPCKLHVKCPQGWAVIADGDSLSELSPFESSLQIFGIKVPEGTLAGSYEIMISCEGDFQGTQNVAVNVNKEIGFKASIVRQEEYYPVGEMIDLEIQCDNLSNVPLRCVLEGNGEPFCELNYESIISFDPHSTRVIPIQVLPDLNDSDTKQFVRITFYREETKERLYQIVLSLDVLYSSPLDDDPYIRIPSHVSFIALGDNNDEVFAAEWAGAGFIDPERNRFLEYIFRLPTENRNVIYNVEQCFYLGLSEPEWRIDLGDTTYQLTPLTERWRWARGAGFEATRGVWSAGAFYAQNTFNNDDNPKEACSFIEWSPNPFFALSGNYMNKSEEGCPTSNIVSLMADMSIFNEHFIELEGGRDFVKESRHKGRDAFRFEARGKLFQDTWYQIEKIYAEPNFDGYYQDVDMFTSTIDFPINQRVRCNLSTNLLRQNLLPDYELDQDAAIPLQRQYNGVLSYNFMDGASFSLNGMLLRGKDLGFCETYNFNQQWGGATLSVARLGYNFLAMANFGFQEDYLTHSTTSPLQRYYLYMGKQLTPNFQYSLFYEGGNTNFYDVKPWRNMVGGGGSYRYGRGSWFEAFFQQVSNRTEDFDLSQASFNIFHTFRNFHLARVSVQYYHYKRHYPNDLLFLVAYTIPFNMPIGKRQDIGSVEGYVYDVWRDCPIPEARVNMNGSQKNTDPSGRFVFSGTSVGEQLIRADMLPKNLITEEESPQKVCIKGGKEARVRVPVVPVCHIKGSIILFAVDEKNLWQEERSTHLLQQGGMPAIRVIIDRDLGKEVYSCLTDKEGNFSFNNLRPGKWRVTINTNALPPLHRVNFNEFNMDIKPEEEREVIFKVVPEERTIQMMNENE